MSSDHHHDITSKLHNISIQQPQFDLKSYLKNNILSINRALDAAVPLRQPERLYEAMRYSVLGEGKRVRALLCLAACYVVGGEESNAMPAACALEMIHSMSLIQDDLPIMDNDDLRRGKPTTHKMFGSVVALLAAGALAALAVQHLATAATTTAANKVAVVDQVGEESTQVTPHTQISSDKILQAIAELASNCGGQGVVAGQLADMELAGTEEVKLDNLKIIHIHKTAKLIEAAVVMGALLGGGTHNEVEKLRLFGLKIGLLFQVVDDILDITQSSDELGKTAGKDLVDDKITYPKLMGLNESKEYAQKLNVEAKDLLLGFDSCKVIPLVALADFIAFRKS